MFTKVRTDRDYLAVMKAIESLVQKAIATGGFHKLAKEEAKMLSNLSELAEAYEDNELNLMPIKPNTLKQSN